MHSEKPLRDPVDVLSTRYWYFLVSIAARASDRALPTAYELEKRFEPEAFGKNKLGDPYHRNKWSKYKCGLHTPNAVLIHEVERQLPGTRAALQHVLWKSLDTDIKVSDHIDDWLTQLEPEVQKVILFHRDILGPRLGRQRHQTLSWARLRMIERRASVDALACLTMLLREAHEAGRAEYAFKLVCPTFYTLLMMAVEHIGLDIAEPMFEIYIERIFSLPRCNGLKYSFNDYPFRHAAIKLNSMTYHLKDKAENDTSWPSKVRYMLKLLGGDYGYDVTFALHPFAEPDLSQEGHSAQAFAEFARHKRLQAWGWNALLTKNGERFPPDHVWKGTPPPSE
jgi:hypothetical protein